MTTGVFIAFETMNKRCEHLSDLELLKNRLFYLTTLYNRSILNEVDGAQLRNLINDEWKEVYYQLGRNKNASIADDEFLRAQ